MIVNCLRAVWFRKCIMRVDCTLHVAPVYSVPGHVAVSGWGWATGHRSPVTGHQTQGAGEDKLVSRRTATRPLTDACLVSFSSRLLLLSVIIHPYTFLLMTKTRSLKDLSLLLHYPHTKQYMCCKILFILLTDWQLKLHNHVENR